MTIYSELSRIQKELKAPKGQYNKFGGYKYRSCEDILEAVKPLLSVCTLTVTDDIIQIGDRYYIKATARLALSRDDYIENSALAREPETKKGMDEAQITGSASSYARKYALNGLFAIDDTQDADATNDHDKTQPKPEAKKELGLNERYNNCLKNLKSLTAEQYTAKDQKFKDAVNNLAKDLNSQGCAGFYENIMTELTRLTAMDFLDGEPKQDYRV